MIINIYIYIENGNSITNDKDKLKSIIYNDYSNLNILLIEEYNLDLSLFYEEFTPIKLDFKEIPLDKLNIIIDKMGIIIENSKKGKTYSFNLENIKTFINTSTNIILSSIKEIIK